jgi:hypothetical protein
MIWVIVSLCIIFVMLVSAAFVFLFLKYKNTSSEVLDLKNKLNYLVTNINNAQFYEYTFDKQQEKNIKHVDKNVGQLEKAIKDLQASVTYLYSNLRTFLQRPNALCIDDLCLTRADIIKLKNLR